MHKRLYWTQLLTGIGIGLIIASLIWIFFPDIFSNLAPLNESGNEVVYYDVSGYDFDVPRLTIPEELLEIKNSESSVDKEFLIGKITEMDDINDADLIAEMKNVLKNSDQASNNKEFDNSVMIEFVVEPGDSADIIALNLQKRGIIENAEEFLQIVRLGRLDRRLRAGSYLWHKGMDITEFVNQLIK